MGTFFTGVLIFDRTGKVALSERKTEGESHKVTVREVHLALGYRQHYFRCRKKNASLLPNFSLSGENKEPREGIEGPTATDDWRYVCASHDGAKFSSLLFARPTRVGIDHPHWRWLVTCCEQRDANISRFESFQLFPTASYCSRMPPLVYCKSFRFAFIKHFTYERVFSSESILRKLYRRTIWQIFNEYHL